MNQNPVIQISHLEKSFGNKKVINDLSFSVSEGDIYGFLGKNGAGKTTTIRMMLNLVRPDSGTILLNGFDVQKDFQKAILQVGAIAGAPVFYSYLSAHTNLSMVADLIPNLPAKRVDEVLHIVGLSNKAKDKVKTFSMGMNQRLGIAYALLSKPKLIILDEPTNGLDPQGMIEIRQLVRQLAEQEKITFLISSHLLNEVEQLCNKVAIINEGKLVKEGAVKELISRDYESVEIRTQTRPQILSLFKGLSYVKFVENSSDGIIVQVEKNSYSQLVKLLINNDCPLESIVPQKTSLESIFLELTGGGQIA